jgi:ubiquinone/menaquinone biosynthesis C-methylase UbiE
MSTSPQQNIQTGSSVDTIAAIAHLLACPKCQGEVALLPDALACTQCGAQFSVADGIARLALEGTSGTWGRQQASEQSDAYQFQYQTLESAAAYNYGYARRINKRMGTRREWRIIRGHLARVGHSQTILELPCGGGRITPSLADATDFIIEADIAIGQIHFGRATSTVTTPRAWLTASAFHIPLRTDSVDGSVCVRLAHHLPTAAEQERLLHELMRVSKRFVIVTFFDHFSFKNLTRRIRHPFNRKPPKITMTMDQVARLARDNGGQLVAAPPLSRIASGHRFALIVKSGAAA